TTAGETVIVGITQETSTAITVTSITLVGPTDSASFTSTGERSVDTGCNNVAELWFVPAFEGGASITVKLSAAADTELWILRVTGLSSNPIGAGSVANDQPSTTTIDVPPIAAPGGRLVVTTAASCAAIQQLAASSPFTDVGEEDGEDTAYLITSTPGSFAVSWKSTAGEWNASTVVFQ
ncbi:MAG TPA: hypothetical protein VMJ10_17160, partial [Kofleriaceae bacterium]|nr:hypothetical protein [Kofleriaceae bacterium]